VRGRSRVSSCRSAPPTDRLALAEKLGFIEVTRVVDDEDGPEIVFELRT